MANESVTSEAKALHEFKIMTAKFENVVLVFKGLSE